MNETETTELVKIFQQFGIYRNSLPEEHNDFVKQQLQKSYGVVTKTYELQGRTYTGTFREDAHRKENKDAYEKEAKLATVLASMGFDVVLIEENNSKSKDGKKPDAIVNGIVMDFKEIEALNENVVGKHTVGNRYQDGMKKKPTAGVAIFLHSFSNQYISEHMEGKSNPSNNGLALFFHEDTGTLQLIDMKKIRTIHIEQSLKIGTPPRTSSEQRSLEGSNTSEEVSSSYLQENNISQSEELSNENTKDSQLQELERKLEDANKTIQSQNTTIQTQKRQLKEQDQILHGKITIVVNGIERTINNGLENGMKEAVIRLDKQIQLNQELSEELAKSKSNNIPPKSPSDDEWDR